MSAARPLLAALCAAMSAALGCTSGQGPDPMAGSQADAGTIEPNATVVHVSDGDTLTVDISGQEESVRLIGIDTPETVDPRKPVQCFGEAASARTTDLVPPGTPIRVERDVEARDRYGRLLGYVYRSSDGLFVNLALVSDGYARTLSIPPNVTHARSFTAAQTEARRRDAGLWSACPDE